MEKIKINGYPDYELHYSKDEQLVWSKRNEKYLKLCKDSKGYLVVSLCKDRKKRTFKIHQIVWMCLKSDIPKDLEINHKDENKENNSIENLELVTHQQNINHGTRNQRHAKAMIGKNINSQSISKPIVGIKKDLSEILQYPSIMEAQRDKDKGFNNAHISSCCNNRYKSHKGYIWFFKSDFEEYMNRFNGNLQDIIKYKLSLFK